MTEELVTAEDAEDAEANNFVLRVLCVLCGGKIRWLRVDPSS